jgi:hypothetical protein
MGHSGETRRRTADLDLDRGNTDSDLSIGTRKTDMDTGTARRTYTYTGR